MSSAASPVPPSTSTPSSPSPRWIQKLNLSFCNAGDPLDRILVQPVQSTDHLFDEMLKLQSRLVTWNSTHKWVIKLMVIGSIVALFRFESENTPVDLKKRRPIKLVVISSI